jgi:catechol 2,3-dioxygenase-like lactoylglutathione lyase family enzyme
MKIKESNITIDVSNIEKSITFYESLGFTLKSRWGNNYAQIIAQGIVIGLHPNKEINSAVGSGSVSIGFTAENFEGIKEELNNVSVTTLERNEEGGQFLHFNDPDGVALYFTKPKW